MNSKRFSLFVVAALFLASAVALHAEPAKPAPRISVRVVDKAQLDQLFQKVCQADGIKGQSRDQALANSFDFLAADCSTACCAHCTRCAETGEIGHCNYCDNNCATLEQ